MRAWAVCACAVVLLGAGCGGSKAKSAGEPERQARAASSGGVQVVVGQSTTGLAGVPAAALPGITVLGTAQESAKPDRAQVSLSIGTGSELGPGGPTFALVEQKE